MLTKFCYRKLKYLSLYILDFCVTVLALKGLKIIRYGSILKPTVYKRLYKELWIIQSFVYCWSSGQSFWLQIQRSRVRSLALPDFLSSSGSGTGSTQPREVKLRSYLNNKSSGSRFRKQRLTAMGTRCANHVTPLYPQVGTNFAYRRRPLCRYGSLAD